MGYLGLVAARCVYVDVRNHTLLGLPIIHGEMGSLLGTYCRQSPAETSHLASQFQVAVSVVVCFNQDSFVQWKYYAVILAQLTCVCNNPDWPLPWSGTRMGYPGLVAARCVHVDVRNHTLLGIPTIHGEMGSLLGTYCRQSPAELLT